MFKALSVKRSRVFRVSLCFFILAILMLVLGILSKVLIPSIVNSAVLDTVVVASEHHPEYDQLKSNMDDGSPPKYNKMWFYNITNPHRVVLGELPEYNLVGPYVYREYYYRHGQFTDDGAIYRYTESIQNKFVPEMSAGPANDTLTIVNLAYFQTMSTYGDESDTLLFGSLQVIPEAIATMKKLLVSGIKGNIASTLITQSLPVVEKLVGGKENMRKRIGGHCGGDGGLKCKNIWTGVGCLYNSLTSGVGQYAEPISTNIIDQVLNAKDKYSILNAENGVGVNYWLEADGVDRKHEIMEHFGITYWQYHHLLFWLQQAGECPLVRQVAFLLINQGVDKAVKVQNWEDVPYRQMLRGDVLQKLQRAKTPISADPASPPELPFAFGGSAEYFQGWNLTTMRCLEELMTANKTYAQQSFLNFHLPEGKAEEFILPSLDDQPLFNSIEECLPSPYGDLMLIRKYLDHVSKTVIKGIFQSKIKAQVNGVFSTRTVHEHVLGYQDEFISFVLEPSDPRHHSIALLPHTDDVYGTPRCTSSADLSNELFSCRQYRYRNSKGQIVKEYYKQPIEMHTGKDDVSLTGQYKSFDGREELKEMFPGRTLQISGGKLYAGTDFEPLNKIQQIRSFQLFVPALTGSVEFKEKGNVDDLFGIKMKRFTFDKFKRSGIEETMRMSLYEPKHLHLIAEEAPADVEGVGEAFVDVEPLTGKAMRARVSVQLTADYSHPEVNLNVFAPLMARKPIPVMIQQIDSQVTADLAQKFKSQVYFALGLSHYVYLVGVIVGSILLVISGIAMYKAKQKNKILLEEEQSLLSDITI
ncbi:hypothetical protein MP228_004419 [Amoeboaphelidium protococcarum]|nr:hypothetical protein MP228_004419 [Amoeboaphelidium protococcarum]